MVGSGWSVGPATTCAWFRGSNAAPWHGTEEEPGPPVVSDGAAGVGADGVERHERSVAELDEDARITRVRIVERHGSTRCELAHASL